MTEPVFARDFCSHNTFKVGCRRRSQGWLPSPGHASNRTSHGEASCPSKWPQCLILAGGIPKSITAR